MEAKNRHAVALGRLGGEGRKRKLTPAQLSAIGKIPWAGKSEQERAEKMLPMWKARAATVPFLQKRIDEVEAARKKNQEAEK
jgi:hypothetical protein